MLYDWKLVWKDFEGSEIWRTTNNYLFCQREVKIYKYFDTYQKALDYANTPSLLKKAERIRNEKVL